MGWKKATTKRPRTKTKIYTRSKMLDEIHYLIFPDEQLFGPTGQSPKTRLVIQAVFNSIKESLLRGEEVTIAGFGTFEIRKYSSKVYHNVTVDNKFDGVKSKVPIRKPAKLRVWFKPSEVLLAMINHDNPEKTYQEKKICRY